MRLPGCSGKNALVSDYGEREGDGPRIFFSSVVGWPSALMAFAMTSNLAFQARPAGSTAALGRTGF
jgi:hypothetical protein